MLKSHVSYTNNLSCEDGVLRIFFKQLYYTPSTAGILDRRIGQSKHYEYYDVAVIYSTSNDTSRAI